MKRILTTAIALATVAFATAQDKPAYRIYNGSGNATDFEQMLKQAAGAEVVFFGELHDNSIAHWLELQVEKELFRRAGSLVVGMEMFEADDQIVLDEYLNGTIEEKHLLSEAKVWDNYKNDYKPIVEFAKANHLKVVATNVPRRYANLVYRKGVEALDNLDAKAKTWIAPLPISVDLELPGYKEMISSMGGHGAPAAAGNLAKSQALKDATMAHFILANMSGIFYHLNGSYHSQNYEGIVWYLKQARPKIKIVTLQVVEQDSVDKLADENMTKADFVIVVPSDMTKTY
ncbi:MAG: ChaN family lipoprotein [Bacteroidia bacterium]|nr:ChaN family lipoprotein [Bacteroidia bacterium]